MTTSAILRWSSQSARPFRTSELFVGLCLLSVAVAWYDNQVLLTRDAFHVLLGDRLDASRIDVQYEMMRRFAVFGYLATPILLAVQIGFLAFATQLCTLLLGSEVALARLFRLGILCHLPLTLDAAARSLWLGSLPPSDVTMNAMNVVPWSLAGIFLDQTNALSPGYAVASAFNISELAWIVILTLGLQRICSLPRLQCGCIAGGLWLASETTLFIIRSFLVP